MMGSQERQRDKPNQPKEQKVKSIKFFKPTLATTLAIVLAWLLSVLPAHAGYTVTLQQVGPDVVATGSGAIDLTGLTFSQSGSLNPLIQSPTLRYNVVVFAIINTGTASSSVDFYVGLLRGPTSFSDRSRPLNTLLTYASIASGDMVGIAGSGYYGIHLSVPTGYVSDTFLSDSATYGGQTFASLGVTPGTYVWTWGTGANQNFTLQITATPVITLSVSPALLNEGSDATFTVSASTVNPSQPITVGYSMSGKAQEGTDYTLSGTPGQFTIPPGQSSATVTLHALADMVNEKNDKAKMKLSTGADYELGKPKKATVTIINVP
jgi:hypothetical protein